MNPPPEHVACPGRVDGGHRKGRFLVQPIAVEQHGTPGAKRDAEHAGVAPSQAAERSLEVPLAGQRLEYVLGKDGDGDRRDQRVRQVVDMFDVARDGNTGLPRDRGGM